MNGESGDVRRYEYPLNEFVATPPDFEQSGADGAAIVTNFWSVLIQVRMRRVTYACVHLRECHDGAWHNRNVKQLIATETYELAVLKDVHIPWDNLASRIDTGRHNVRLVLELQRKADRFCPDGR